MEQLTPKIEEGFKALSAMGETLPFLNEEYLMILKLIQDGRRN